MEGGAPETPRKGLNGLAGGVAPDAGASPWSSTATSAGGSSSSHSHASALSPETPASSWPAGVLRATEHARQAEAAVSGGGAAAGAARPPQVAVAAITGVAAVTAVVPQDSPLQQPVNTGAAAAGGVAPAGRARLKRKQVPPDWYWQEVEQRASSLEMSWPVRRTARRAFITQHCREHPEEVRRLRSYEQRRRLGEEAWAAAPAGVKALWLCHSKDGCCRT